MVGKVCGCRLGKAGWWTCNGYLGSEQGREWVLIVCTQIMYSNGSIVKEEVS